MPSLYGKLKLVKSEEDVKDAYIHALGLKKYTKGLIDIRTREIWFEAKDRGDTSSYKMFTQLLHYVQDGLNKGEELPPFLAVVDTEKAALMKTAVVIPFLKKKTIKWGKSATKFPKEALDQVSAYIGAHLVSFKIPTHEAEFISTVKAAIKTGDIVRTQITPDCQTARNRDPQSASKKDPSIAVGLACPGSEQEGPARPRSAFQRRWRSGRVGGACLPTWASRGWGLGRGFLN